MKTPPSMIGEARVLLYVVLTAEHKHTGNTKHYVEGGLTGAVPALVICQYPQDNGYYLFYCDDDWEVITDTYHDSVERAMTQAAFEYERLAGEMWKHYEHHTAF